QAGGLVRAARGPAGRAWRRRCHRRRARAGALRSPGGGRRGTPGRPARGVRRDPAQRLVDHLPRGPAGPRARRLTLLMRYFGQSDFAHGELPAATPIGVVLANLGTPDAPDAPALRRYLREL